MTQDENSEGSGRQEDSAVVIPFRRPEQTPAPKEPLINLPPATKYFALLLLLIHTALSLGLPAEQRYWVYEHFGFIPRIYTGGETLPLTAYTAPFTYMLLHGNWAHVLINVVMLAAFGAGAERWLGARRMLLFFTLCGLASIFVQFLLAPHADDVVIGASGGLSGLFAAVLVMMYRAGAMPQGRFGLWPVALTWVAVSALFGVTGGPGGEMIAWAAHIGGFAAGFAFLPFFLRKSNISIN